MTFTVNDILGKIEAFHGQLNSTYAKMTETTERPRVKMMLNYLVSHEKLLKESITEYKETSHSEILEYCFKFVPDFNIIERFKELPFSSTSDKNEVLKIVLEFDDFLINIYNQLAEEAESNQVREFFTKLLVDEKREKLTIVRNTMELDLI